LSFRSLRPEPARGYSEPEVVAAGIDPGGRAAAGGSATRELGLSERVVVVVVPVVERTGPARVAVAGVHTGVELGLGDHAVVVGVPGTMDADGNLLLGHGVVLVLVEEGTPP